MEMSVLISGFGGQGVQTLGKLLTYSANEDELYVTFYPSYGAEMRGGTSSCTVVLSDEEIAAPYRSQTDMVVALNHPSYAAFYKTVKENGTFIYNSDLVELKDPREDVKHIGLPLNTITSQLGSPLTMNVVMLGFLAEHIDGLTAQSAENIVKEKLGKRKSMLEGNLKAFATGVGQAKL